MARSVTKSTPRAVRTQLMGVRYWWFMLSTYGSRQPTPPSSPSSPPSPRGGTERRCGNPRVEQTE